MPSGQAGTTLGIMMYVEIRPFAVKRFLGWTISYRHVGLLKLPLIEVPEIDAVVRESGTCPAPQLLTGVLRNP